MKNYDEWKLTASPLNKEPEPIMVSNCCGVKAASEADELWGICSQCFEHCDYVKEDER